MAWTGLVPALTLAVLAVLGLGLAMAAARRTPAGSATMPFWGHFAELRRRVLRVSAVFVAALGLSMLVRFEPVTVAGWNLILPVPSLYDPLAAQLFRAMADYVVPDGVRLVTLNAMDGFSAQFTTSLAIAVAVALPTALLELGLFLGPALRPRERRLLAWSILPAMALFVLGAGFGFFVILPPTLDALYNFAAPLGAEPLLYVADLSSFTVAFMLGIGVAFQAPLVMAALARVGLVHPASYLRKWRHSVLVILFVAMVVTPDPTIVSQLLLGLPLIALYFLGVAASFVVAKPRAA